MKIVIVGIGKVGLALTKQLSVENKVTVVDEETAPAIRCRKRRMWLTQTC